MAAASVQEPRLTSVGAVVTSAGTGVTVKIALQVTKPQPVVEVDVNITVFEPPQISGAPVLLFESTPFVALAVLNHNKKAVLISACDVQAVIV